jgi:hypothetical protein
MVAVEPRDTDDIEAPLAMRARGEHVEVTR